VGVVRFEDTVATHIGTRAYDEYRDNAVTSAAQDDRDAGTGPSRQPIGVPCDAENDEGQRQDRTQRRQAAAAQSVALAELDRGECAGRERRKAGCTLAQRELRRKRHGPGANRRAHDGGGKQRHKGGGERTEQPGGMVAAGHVRRPQAASVREDGDEHRKRDARPQPLQRHTPILRTRTSRFPVALRDLIPPRDVRRGFEKSPPGPDAGKPHLPQDVPTRHMRPTTKGRVPNETSDAVGLIITLLVRFPEIATIVSHPTDGTLTLSFGITSALDRVSVMAVRDSVNEHVRALLACGRDEPDALEVRCDSDAGMSFVRITRDVRSLTREELHVLVAVLADRFGERLVKSPASDDAFDDDVAADEVVEYALEALRDPAHQRSLVGYREEKRVLVYFMKAKKAKARART